MLAAHIGGVAAASRGGQEVGRALPRCEGRGVGLELLWDVCHFEDGSGGDSPRFEMAFRLGFELYRSAAQARYLECCQLGSVHLDVFSLFLCPGLLIIPPLSTFIAYHQICHPLAFVLPVGLLVVPPSALRARARALGRLLNGDIEGAVDEPVGGRRANGGLKWLQVTEGEAAQVALMQLLQKLPELLLLPEVLLLCMLCVCEMRLSSACHVATHHTSPNLAFPPYT